MALFNWLPVWRRNFLVWRKLALPSILGNLADPLIYMLGLGYGLGAMLPSIDGQPYVAFLAAARCAPRHERGNLRGPVFLVLPHACPEDLGLPSSIRRSA